MPLQQTPSVVRDLLPQLDEAAQLNQELDIDIRLGWIRITRGNMTTFLSLDDLKENQENYNPNDMNSPNNRLFRQYPGLEQVFYDWYNST